jgi:acetyl-CoA acetyltransferase
MGNSLSKVAIAGVGYSQTGRRLPLTDDQLVSQAVLAALADAGMKPTDLDGVSTNGGNAMSIGHLVGAMPLNYYFTSSGMAPAFVEPATMAVSAVASGLAHTCVAVRLIRQMPSAGDRPSPTGPVEPMRVGGDMQFSAPFGASASAAGIGGFQMQRYMQQYGVTEEQFAVNAVTQRHHASLNPEAILRDPITVEDYLSSRYISKPVRLLDCDYPVDSSSAVIFTTQERAADWAKKPVNVEASAYSAIRDFDMSLLDDFTSNAPKHCADTLWSRTDLTVADLDCAQLYDGFTIITFEWLEALGICGPGEAGDFIEAGNTKLGGSMPLNTDGGACNMGRRHGANFCIESVQQIRGESGERQVPDCEVAVWSNAVGPFAGAMLLTA